MSRPTSKKLENPHFELLILTFALIIMVFTSINIANFIKPKKVLAASTSEPFSKEEYWSEFLLKNPDYIPGWIEIGRLDKVSEIDPNYFRLNSQ